MYSHILPEGDKLKKLDRIQKLDLEDYISMRNLNLIAIAKFNGIKSMIVTEQGMTLWQFSENYLNHEFRPIGQDESPVSLFQWILTNGKFI